MNLAAHVKRLFYQSLAYGEFAPAATPYLPTATLAGLTHVEANWMTIRDEALALRDTSFIAYRDRSLTASGWKLFPLYAWGLRLENHCAACPKTTALVESIPHMTSAAFSVLARGASFAAHRGNPTGIMRYHLGLRVPDRCAFLVAGVPRPWRDGEGFVFDDTFIHEARNDGDFDRIILIVDIRAKPHGGNLVERAFFTAERERYRLIARAGTTASSSL